MKARHAFSLVEILVVVAILAALIGAVTIGFKMVGKTTSESATRGTLEVCRSMFAEYELQSNGGKNLTYPGTPPVPVPAPGSVVDGSDDRTGDAVVATRIILAQILAIPQARALSNGLPTEVRFTFPDDAISAGDLSTTPVLLDAWNNPILFIPAGGMANVTTGDQVVTIRSPEGRPFFASAGQDGNFEKGDDNLYSFEN